MDDYCLDADRIYASEMHSATIFQLSDAESEGSSLPFGFTRHRDLQATPVQLPEPWMWWH